MGHCEGLDTSFNQYCVNGCVGDSFTRLVRGDVLVHYAHCINELQCSDLGESDARDTCFNDAFESVSPSKACAKFCEANTQTAFECGYRGSIDECVRYNCGVVDSVLNEASQCATRGTCSSWESCLDEAFTVD